MRTILPILFVALMAASCEKESCYNCTTYVRTKVTGSPATTTSSTSAFCGTKNEVEDFIEQNTSEQDSYDGKIQISVVTGMKCE